MALDQITLIGHLKIQNGHNFSRWPPKWLILVKIFAVVRL